MSDRITIEEEHFGILTDDALALEATLVRAAGCSDEEVRSVRVWLPKYPLTRSSVLPAARAEARALGAESRAIYLTFDLRGSGESDGEPSDEGFEIDIHSAHEWAKERFGPEVAFQVCGFPDLGAANRLVALPLRPGVLVELYRYHPDDVETQAHVIYLSRYGHFGREDDALCRSVADAGYVVYGGDLLRYLLLAGPLTTETFAQDAAGLAVQLGRPLYLVARALAAGPALLMASTVPAVNGVVVTGEAQEGLAAAHLFSQENPARLMLLRQVKKLAPRPAVFFWDVAEAGGAAPDDLKALSDVTQRPRLWGMIPKIDAPILLKALGWLGENRPT